MGSTLRVSEVESVRIDNVKPSPLVIPSEYWTREQVIQEFQVDDIPLDDVQKSRLIDLLYKYAEF